VHRGGVSTLPRKLATCLGFSCLDPETFNHAFSVLWRVWFLRVAAFGRSGERSRSLSGQARAGDCKWCPWAGFVYFLLYKTVNCHWPLPWEQHCRSLDDGLRFNEPMSSYFTESSFANLQRIAANGRVYEALGIAGFVPVCRHKS